MKYGAVFPQTEIGPEPIAVRDYAQAVEDLGYDYLLTFEHVLGANPDRPGGWVGRSYTHQSLFHEPFVMFGYLAGLTKKIEFATGILILPQRQTVLVAKQAAEVDVLSGGRLRLGIGVGWNDVEYEALGESFANRGRRSEEQIELLRKLWTETLVTFEGQYHRVSDAGLNPLPLQQPIPIWIGGGADAVLRRMARLGDGWFPQGSVEQVKPLLEKLSTYLEVAGRSLDNFGIDAHLRTHQHPQNTWPDLVTAWQSLGATHLTVNTMGAGCQSVTEHIALIQTFKDTVG